MKGVSAAVSEPRPFVHRLPLYVICAIIFSFLILPLLIIIPISFSSALYLQFPPPGWSLQWYERFFGQPGWMHSLSLSFQIALLSTLFSTVLGILTSVAMVRGRFPGKTIIYAFLLSPMIIPVIITAVAIFFFFAKFRMVGNPFAIALGHTVTSLPIVLIVVSATLQGFDTHLEQAAIIMGASPLRAFIRITLPIIAPGVFSGAIFAFLHSFDELLISLFLASAANQTLPVRIWNSVLLQVEPTIAAVSSVLIGFTVVALVVMNVVQRR